ncbi:uncharacterized protein EKO05_0000677 [Ascochyta rabiei]|uniref:Uncharacterized protein n=1 Tax=Didymella rabiei TaxID=5454 RepID=A0A162VVT7_DIDRA|nr:uncharacterized protein EKO05_0000677 [Ascochyta rabiei]KZM18635.1 hypothetical protein ST47_g10242 [Ascochyta rabiei]UPX10001.1 hypothetical protein EKO05_0000677 [Ascochyta rabiei]
MSQEPNTNALTFGNIEDILELAQKQLHGRFSDPEYSYVHNALDHLFYLGILECRAHRGNPAQILKECLQDERIVLDRHNRLQGKILLQQEMIYDVSESPENFPLRHLILEKGISLPANNFRPIYHLVDDPEKLQAAHNARRNIAGATTRSDSSSPRTMTGYAPKQHANKSGSNHDKLYDAPSPEHSFPDGNITLAEIAAFIPQSIKSWDIIDRIIWNSAKAEDIAKLFNKHRAMPAGAIVNNTVYMMMRGQMYKRSKEDVAYKGWTVGTHQHITKPDEFDPHSISVTGFRRPRIFANRSDNPADPVPFKDLANGVAVWPEHGDALDLTRCVSWCVANPEAQYFYPVDFQKVLHECLGGPVIVKPRNEDAQILSRLRVAGGTYKPRDRVTKDLSDDDTDEHKRDAVAHSEKRKRSTRVDGYVNRRKTLSSRSTRASRTSTARTTTGNSSFSFQMVDSEDDTDDNAYQGPKRTKKNKAAPRRSERTKKSVQYDDGAMIIDEEEGELEEDQGTEREAQKNDSIGDEDDVDDGENDEIYQDE